MRNSKKESRKEQILISAGKVFAKKGYHATSISDICHKADIARGTVYLYFQNKRGIFDTLIKNFTSTILKNIAIFSPDQNLPEQFNQNIRLTIETIVQNKDLTKIIVSEAVGLDSEFDHQLILFYAKMGEYIEGALTMLQKTGEIPLDVNVRILSYSIVGTIKEIAYQWSIDAGNVLDMDPLIIQLKDFDINKFIGFKGAD